MMRKISSLILSAILVAMVFTGCNSSNASQTTTSSTTKSTSDTTATTASNGEKSLNLGFVVMDVSNPVFVASIEGAKAYAEKHNYKLTVIDGASSAEKQVSGMENLIQTGVDAIDLRAVDSNALKDSVIAASKAGIKVNTYPDIEGRASVLRYDDYDQGVKLAEEAAKWINEKLGGKAEVAFLTQPTVDAVMERVDGFKDVLSKQCPGATIIQEVEGYLPDKGMAATESILQAHPNVKVILCVNDSGALGAYEALVSSGKKLDDFFLGGIDGVDAALEKIKANSVYRATVAGKLTFQEIGYSCMRNIAQAALGNSFEEIFKVEVMAINAANVEAYQTRQPDYSALEK